WHARQSRPPEFDRVRNMGTTGSLPGTCGSWQVVHSTLPPFSFTAASLVDAGLANSVAASEPSSTGVMLTGWLGVRLAPSMSGAAIAPEVAISPFVTVSPVATVPSWQLRQSLDDPAAGVCTPD